MDYRIIESFRKTIAIQVDENGDVLIRVPLGYPKSKIEQFVQKNIVWIEKSVIKQKQNLNNRLELSDEDVNQLKRYAEKIIPPKVDYYSGLMSVKPRGMKITSAKKRFGSCSVDNSLCFSYMLMLYPEEAIDYVIVHELAHIVHHNHSEDFYNLVLRFMPDYKNREKLLKSKQCIPENCND